GRDELVIAQPNHVCASAQAGVSRLESESGNTIKFLPGSGVVKKQMLPCVSQETVTATGIDADGVPTGHSAEVCDLVGVGVVSGIELEDANTGEAFQTVDAISVQGNVKRIGIGLHWRSPPGTPQGSALDQGSAGA